MIPAAPPQSKIVLQASDVASYVEKWRAQGKKIVLTQGSFDLVHIGHARYCAKAKEYGDVLIVGVDSDAKVRQRKGDDRPVVPQDERLEMLTYLAAVDLVVLKELESEKYSLIKAVRPDVLVATAETYTPEKIKKLEEWCGEVVVLDPMATTSTSAKIRRLQIGMVQKISDKLSTRLNNTIAEVLKELRGE
jgi:D-beta-D-heptose 7-phosphate kinase/D-beta-D-heptose 1-phosphate adenosyltransferase